MRPLKHWVTYNWYLKLISLGLAAMLWMFVATEASSEIGLEVPLEYRNIPPQLEITGDTTNMVQVRLRGSSNVIRDISPRDVSTTIDLSKMKSGEKIIPLSPQNVQAPFGAEVVRVNPSSVRFDLERTLRKTVPVVATIQGQPTDGFELGSVMVNPNCSAHWPRMPPRTEYPTPAARIAINPAQRSRRAFGATPSFFADIVVR